MFGARSGRGGPAPGADCRVLAGDGEVSSSVQSPERTHICCLLGKQKPEREPPLGWKPGRGGGCRAAARVRKTAFWGSVDIFPVFGADARRRRASGKARTRVGTSSQFQRRWALKSVVDLTNSLENFYCLTTFNWLIFLFLKQYGMRYGFARHPCAGAMLIFSVLFGGSVCAAETGTHCYF